MAKHERTRHLSEDESGSQVRLGAVDTNVLDPAHHRSFELAQEKLSDQTAGCRVAHRRAQNGHSDRLHVRVFPGAEHRVDERLAEAVVRYVQSRADDVVRADGKLDHLGEETGLGLEVVMDECGVDLGTTGDAAQRGLVVPFFSELGRSGGRDRSSRIAAARLARAPSPAGPRVQIRHAPQSIVRTKLQKVCTTVRRTDQRSGKRASVWSEPPQRGS